MSATRCPMFASSPNSELEVPEERYSLEELVDNDEDELDFSSPSSFLPLKPEKPAASTTTATVPKELDESEWWMPVKSGLSLEPEPDQNIIPKALSDPFEKAGEDQMADIDSYLNCITDDSPQCNSHMAATVAAVAEKPQMLEINETPATQSFVTQPPLVVIPTQPMIVPVQPAPTTLISFSFPTLSAQPQQQFVQTQSLFSMPQFGFALPSMFPTSFSSSSSASLSSFTTASSSSMSSISSMSFAPPAPEHAIQPSSSSSSSYNKTSKHGAHAMLSNPYASAAMQHKRERGDKGLNGKSEVQRIMASCQQLVLASGSSSSSSASSSTATDFSSPSAVFSHCFNLLKSLRFREESTTKSKWRLARPESVSGHPLPAHAVIRTFRIPKDQLCASRRELFPHCVIQLNNTFQDEVVFCLKATKNQPKRNKMAVKCSGNEWVFPACSQQVQIRVFQLEDDNRTKLEMNALVTAEMRSAEMEQTNGRFLKCFLHGRSGHQLVFQVVTPSAAYVPSLHIQTKVVKETDSRLTEINENFQFELISTVQT